MDLGAGLCTARCCLEYFRGGRCGMFTGMVGRFAFGAGKVVWRLAGPVSVDISPQASSRSVDACVVPTLRNLSDTRVFFALSSIIIIIIIILFFILLCFFFFLALINVRRAEEEKLRNGSCRLQFVHTWRRQAWPIRNKRQKALVYH